MHPFSNILVLSKPACAWTGPPKPYDSLSPANRMAVDCELTIHPDCQKVPPYKRGVQSVGYLRHVKLKSCKRAFALSCCRIRVVVRRSSIWTHRIIDPFLYFRRWCCGTHDPSSTRSAPVKVGLGGGEMFSLVILIRSGRMKDEADIR